MSRGFDERELAIAKVYAEAALGLAPSAEAAAELAAEAAAVAATVAADPPLEGLVASPAVDAESRRTLVEKIFRGRVSDLLVDTLQVMNSKGRLGLLGAFAAALAAARDRAEGLLSVEVVSAVPLSDELRRRLREAAIEFAARRARASGEAWVPRQARLEETVDPELIAGLVVRFGDEKIDGSAAHQLELVKNRLLDRASKELHRGAGPQANEVG